MPGWLITLLSVAASALVSGIVGYIVKRSLDKYFTKRDKEEAEKEKKLAEAEILKEEKKNKELEEMINRIVKKHTDPIDHELGILKNGTLDTLRDRILSTYYKCVEKGYRAQYDFENIHHMYEDYVDLHGNSFVEDVMKKFDKNLLSEEEYKAAKKKKVAARNKNT